MAQEKRQPPAIVRTADIVVGSVFLNDYGDLVVTDKGGDEHKIGKKRPHLFPVFQPGVAIHLSYAQYMNKEYIVNATPLEQMITETQPPPTGAEQQPIPRETKVAPQELGMWWKELGESIRSGEIDKSYPKSAVKIRSQYYNKMFSVTGIEKETN